MLTPLFYTFYSILTNHNTHVSMINIARPSQGHVTNDVMQNAHVGVM
jgi:hypothetical protein